MPPLKKFSIQFSHFFLGSGLSLLFGFVTFPILTRILSKEQYGVMGLVITTMLLLVSVSKAGLSNGIIRFYQNYKDSEEKRTIFSTTVVVRGFLFSGITVLSYLVVFPAVRGYIGIADKFVLCFMIMAIYLLIRPMNIIILNLLRVNDKTIFFNLLNLIGRIISVSLSLVVYVYVVHKLYGYFIGIILGEIALSICLFFWFFSNYKINCRKVSKHLTFDLLKFGAPLLFTELSYLLLSYADRYMIMYYYGEKELGLYTVGYNLAMYIADLVTFAMSYAIVPIFVEIYEKSGREETEEFLMKCLYYLLIGIIPICFGYYAICKDMLIFLASKKYIAATNFSPIILIGTIFLGMNNVLNAGLYLQKKSGYILFIMIMSVIINIVLNVILLPKYSIEGAAIATLIACLVSTTLTVSLSYKYIFVRVDLKNVIYYSILSFVMLIIIQRIEIGIEWVNLVLKISIGVSILLIGVMIKDKDILSKIIAIAVKSDNRLD